VKRVDGDQVVETVDRDRLVSAQTPQAFVWPTLRDAVAAGEEATDCAALVEARGGRVKVIPGDRRLIKVTEPADLDLAASWL
jgi:2-C-methyl-D-erythritol 4-phosphate cytidylyltransferase